MIDKDPSAVKALRITQVDPKQNSYPMILSFQNEINSNFASRVDECHLKFEPDRPGHSAVVSADGFLYHGREKVDSTFRNLILVKNRATGDVRLIEVGHASMKAFIREEIQAFDETDKQQLGEKFGSKRTKRAAEQSKKMKVDLDAVKEQLTASIMKIDVDAIDTSQINVEDSTSEKYLPPMDRNATDPKGVFKLSDIFSPEQFDTLKTFSGKYFESKESEIVVGDYIKKLMPNISSLETKLKIDSCCALLYADCIVRYLTENYRAVCNSHYKPCEYSDVISESILEKFSLKSDKGRTRPQSMKDKAVSHIIVLLLIAGNCIIPCIDDLRKALNTPLNKLTQMIKVVGARTSVSNGKTSIVLKLPLVSPPSLKTKRDRK